MFTRTKKSGFTLIEMLLSFTIIGILSSGILVATRYAPERAYVARISSDLRTLKNAALLWYADNRDGSLQKMEEIINSNDGIELLRPYVDVRPSKESSEDAYGYYRFHILEQGGKNWWAVSFTVNRNNESASKLKEILYETTSLGDMNLVDSNIFFLKIRKGAELIND